MAQAKVSNFSKWLILLGDGAGPEVFSAPCGLTSRGLDLSASSNDVTVPDCDDEDAAAWTARVIDALSGTISGSGVMDRDSHETWRDWFLSAEAKNVRMSLDETGANGGGYYAGAFILTKLTITGERGNKVLLEVEMQSDGAITWTDAA